LEWLHVRFSSLGEASSVALAIPCWSQAGFTIVYRSVTDLLMKPMQRQTLSRRYDDVFNGGTDETLAVVDATCTLRSDKGDGKRDVKEITTSRMCDAYDNDLILFIAHTFASSLVAQEPDRAWEGKH
jgi:hypothetical protein